MEHSVNTQNRWNAVTRRLSILIVVTVMACIGGLVVADVATAQQGIERSGNVVTVELPDADEEIETVEMAVEATDVRYTDSPEEGDDTVSMFVNRPTSGTVDGVSLTNETVNVEFQTENGVLEEDTITTQLSLHSVAFDNELPVWIENETVRVPLNGSETTGLTTDDRVKISIGDQQETGTVLYDNEQLDIDQDTLIAASNSEEISIDVLDTTGDSSVTINGPKEIEPEIRSNENDLVVWSPLFEPDTTYEIDAVDANGDQYEETSQPVAPGHIELPSLEPGEIEVTVREDGNSVVERTGDIALNYNGPLIMDAAITDDGGTLEFDRSLADLSITALAADPEHGEAYYTSLDTQIDGEGQFLLDETIQEDDSLLVLTDAGIAAVQIQTDEDTGWLTQLLSLVPFGLTFTTPLLVGVLVGVFGVLSGNRTTTINKLIIVGFSLLFGILSIVFVMLVRETDPLTFSSIHMIGGVGILIGTVTAVGIYEWRGADTIDPNGTFPAQIDFDGYQPSQGSFVLEKREAGQNMWQSDMRISTKSYSIDISNTNTWEIRAIRGGKASSIATISRESPNATITVPVQKTITVTDTAGKEVPNATVQIDDENSGTTDQDGAVSVTLQGDAANVKADISHPKYESQRVTVPVVNGEQTVRLNAHMGELQIVSSVDGVTTGSVPVDIELDEDPTNMRHRADKTETGTDGVFTESVMIGRYRIASALSSNKDAFRSDETTITVRDGTTTTAEIDLRFTGQLTADHHARIDRIRADVRSLTDGRGQDTAIQQYYGSVVESMLATAESVPDSGHAFVGTETEPAVAIETILTMAEATTTAINNAMTTKRNVDLFAACSDLPPTDITWNGGCDLIELLDRLDTFDSGQSSRREIKERYEAVRKRIETERPEVAEISPVLEMHDRTWEMISEAGRGIDAEGVHYGSLLLLDSIETLFDHDPLRERLSRTVF